MPRLSPLHAYTQDLRADLRAELPKGFIDWTKEIKLRKFEQKGGTRYQVLGRTDRGRFCRTLNASTPSQAVRKGVKVVLAFHNGVEEAEFLPTPNSLKKIERGCLTEILDKGLRRDGERRKIRHLKQTVERLTAEQGGQVTSMTLMALINSEPKGSRRQESMVETCRRIARSAGIDLVLPTRTREEIARRSIVPVREALTDDEVREFLLNDVAPLLKSESETFYRAAWLYALTALTGSRMNALCTLDETIDDLSVGKEYPIYDTKRDKTGRVIICLKGVEQLDLTRRPDNLPSMSSSIRPKDEDLDAVNIIVATSMNIMRRKLGTEKHTKFTPRQLRHSCAARLIMNGVPTVMVAGTLNTSEAMIEKTYGGMARSFAAKTIGDLLG